MKEKVLIVFFITLSLSLILNAQVWDKQNEITPCGKIAYDSDNMTYMVGSKYYKITFSKSSDGGATWSEKRELGHPHYFPDDPDIAVDSNNNIYIVYHWSFPWRVDQELFLIKSTNRGEDWTEPIQITDTPYCTARHNILIDSNDVIHVIWNEVIYEPEPPDTPMGVFHISSEDGGETWSVPVQIEKAYEKQDALVDSNNNIYVFGRPFADSNGEWLNEVYCFKSEDGGENWTYTYAGPWFFPAAAVDTNDALHLVTDNYGETLYYQYSLDGGETWSEPEAIAFLTGIEDWPYTPKFLKDIAVDKMNNIIVAYQNVSEENYEIHYIRSPNRGLTWIREWKLTETSQHSLDPKLVIDSNYIIHLTWDEFTGGVYYIRGFLRGRGEIK